MVDAFEIVHGPHGAFVAERAADGLTLWHSEPIEPAAAKRLCADLNAGEMPLPVMTCTDAHDPAYHAARCYSIALYIVPVIERHLTDTSAAIWRMAVCIADAEPWIFTKIGGPQDDEIPL